MSVVKYSPLCDTDSALYLSYLFCLSLSQDKCQDGGNGDVGDKRGVAGAKVVAGFSEFLAVAGKAYSVGHMAWDGSSVTRGFIRGVDSSEGVSEGRESSRLGEGSGVGFFGADVCRDDGGCGLRGEPSGGSGVSGVVVGEVSSGQNRTGCVGDGCGSRSESNVPGLGGRGPHYGRNKIWREKKRAAKAMRAKDFGRDRASTGERRSGVDSENWRSKDSVVSSVSGSVKEETDMERKIREATEKRKFVETQLATRKAELALRRMNDTVMTELYDNRVKQEGICRMNQAIVKSEKSLSNLKSVSPGSSATPGEIRRALLEAESWKAKEKKIHAWVAAGEPKGVIAGILNEGKETEISSMDSEMKQLCADHGCGPEFVEEVAAEQVALLEEERAYEAKAGERAAAVDVRHRNYLKYVKGRSVKEGFKCSDHLADWELALLEVMEKEEQNGI